MRCNDCGKFVSYDDPVVEVQSVDLDGAELTAEVRVALPCAECGTELKETTLNLAAAIAHTCDRPAPLAAEAEAAELYEMVVEPYDGDFTSRQEGTGRYRRTYYGARVDVEVRCRACDATFTVILTGDEQASNFDEL